MSTNTNETTSLDDVEAIQARFKGNAAVAAQGGDASGEPVSLETALAIGKRVNIGESDYEIAGFALGQIFRAQELISQLPDSLISIAITAAQKHILDAKAIADQLTSIRRLNDKTVDAVSVETIEYLSLSLFSEMGKAQIDALIDLIHLAIQRRHPDISREIITTSLDFSEAIFVLATIFSRNGAILKRF